MSSTPSAIESRVRRIRNLYSFEIRATNMGSKAKRSVRVGGDSTSEDSFTSGSLSHATRCRCLTAKSDSKGRKHKCGAGSRIQGSGSRVQMTSTKGKKAVHKSTRFDPPQDGLECSTSDDDNISVEL